jgi:hypothetical protein
MCKRKIKKLLRKIRHGGYMNGIVSVRSLGRKYSDNVVGNFQPGGGMHPPDPS